MQTNVGVDPYSSAGPILASVLISRKSQFSPKIPRVNCVTAIPATCMPTSDGRPCDYFPFYNNILITRRVVWTTHPWRSDRVIEGMPNDIRACSAQLWNHRFTLWGRQLHPTELPVPSKFFVLPLLSHSWLCLAYTSKHSHTRAF